MAKILTFAAASGPAMDESTPVREKSRRPATLRQRHPRSASTSVGMAAVAQTIDNSSAVRVTEERLPSAAQTGVGSVASSRAIPYSSSSTSSFMLRSRFNDVRQGNVPCFPPLLCPIPIEQKFLDPIRVEKIVKGQVPKHDEDRVMTVLAVFSGLAPVGWR